MLKITVLTPIQVESAVSAKGKPYTKRTQEAVFESDDMKQRFQLSVNEKGHAVGSYLVDPVSMFAAGKYGPDLRFQSDWKLTAVKA